MTAPDSDRTAVEDHPDGGQATVGLDLGGTKIAAVVLDGSGVVLAEEAHRHGASGQAVLDTVEELARDLMVRWPGTRGIGLAVAGLVAAHSGEFVTGALVELHRQPVGDRLAAATGRPVAVENDANATLAAVLHRVPAAEDATTLLVALGTGVGGALAVGNHVVRGASGFAGEFGHLTVDPRDRSSCACGGSGCLELLAGGSALTRAASGLPGIQEPATSHALLERARAHDPAATRLLVTAGSRIGDALANLVTAFDPAHVYLSGGFGHAAADFLIPAITTRLRERRPFARYRPLPPVLLDPIGPTAAATGAAHLAARHTPAPRAERLPTP